MRERARNGDVRGLGDALPVDEAARARRAAAGLDRPSVEGARAHAGAGHQRDGGREQHARLARRPRRRSRRSPRRPRCRRPRAPPAAAEPRRHRARGGRGAADHCSSSSATSVGIERAHHSRRPQSARPSARARPSSAVFTRMRLAAGALDDDERLTPPAQPLGDLARAWPLRAPRTCRARAGACRRSAPAAARRAPRRAPGARPPARAVVEHVFALPHARAAPSSARALRARSLEQRREALAVARAVGRTDAGVWSTTQRASSAAATSSDAASASSSARPAASSPTTRGSTTLKTKPGGTSLAPFRSVRRAGQRRVDRAELDQVEAGLRTSGYRPGGRGSPTRRRAIARISPYSKWNHCVGVVAHEAFHLVRVDHCRARRPSRSAVRTGRCGGGGWARRCRPRTPCSRGRRVKTGTIGAPLTAASGAGPPGTAKGDPKSSTLRPRIPGGSRSICTATTPPLRRCASSGSASSGSSPMWMHRMPTRSRAPSCSACARASRSRRITTSTSASCTDVQQRRRRPASRRCAPSRGSRPGPRARAS